MFRVRVSVFKEVRYVDDDSESDSDSESDEYNGYNSPRSYRQPSGNGQSLSRRYCKQSGWLYRWADHTAAPFQGALTSSCKYFKQFK